MICCRLVVFLSCPKALLIPFPFLPEYQARMRNATTLQRCNAVEIASGRLISSSPLGLYVLVVRGNYKVDTKTGEGIGP